MSTIDEILKYYLVIYYITFNNFWRSLHGRPGTISKNNSSPPVLFHTVVGTEKVTHWQFFYVHVH